MGIFFYILGSKHKHNTQASIKKKKTTTIIASKISRAFLCKSVSVNSFRLIISNHYLAQN